MRFMRLDLKERTCFRCPTTYRPSRYNQKFCSVSCGSRSHPSGRLGTKQSAVTRAKISEALLGRPQSWTHRNGRYIDGRYSNKEYVSWHKNQWHYRRKRASGSHTFQEWEALKERCHWTCQHCGKKEPEIKLTQDHIVPLSKGGSDSIDNIQPLCKSCNCKKWTKI